MNNILLSRLPRFESWLSCALEPSKLNKIKIYMSICEWVCICMCIWMCYVDLFPCHIQFRAYCRKRPCINWTVLAAVAVLQNERSRESPLSVHQPSPAVTRFSRDSPVPRAGWRCQIWYQYVCLRFAVRNDHGMDANNCAICVGSMWSMQQTICVLRAG